MLLTDLSTHSHLNASYQKLFCFMCVSVVCRLVLSKGFGGEGGAGLFGKPPPPPVKHNIRDQSFGPPAGIYYHLIYVYKTSDML